MVSSCGDYSLAEEDVVEDVCEGEEGYERADEEPVDARDPVDADGAAAHG